MTYGHDSPLKALGGFLFYDYVPENRFTNNQSYYLSDIYEVVFARPRTFSEAGGAVIRDKPYVNRGTKRR